MARISSITRSASSGRTPRSDAGRRAQAHRSSSCPVCDQPLAPIAVRRVVPVLPPGLDRSFWRPRRVSGWKLLAVLVGGVMGVVVTAMVMRLVLTLS